MKRTIAEKSERALALRNEVAAHVCHILRIWKDYTPEVEKALRRFERLDRVWNKYVEIIVKGE